VPFPVIYVTFSSASAAKFNEIAPTIEAICASTSACEHLKRDGSLHVRVTVSWNLKHFIAAQIRHQEVPFDEACAICAGLKLVSSKFDWSFYKQVELILILHSRGIT